VSIPNFVGFVSEGFVGHHVSSPLSPPLGAVKRAQNNWNGITHHHTRGFEIAPKQEAGQLPNQKTIKKLGMQCSWSPKKPLELLFSSGFLQEKFCKIGIKMSYEKYMN